MKKILIFSLAYYPRVGGAEVAIKEITDRIAPEDIEFHMVTMRFSSTDAKEEKIGNVTVYRVGGGESYLSKILFVPRAARAARRLHAQEKFDGVWAMMSYMLFPLVLAGLSLPYALTLEEGDPFEHMFKRLRIRPFLPLLRRGFRRAAVVHAESTFLGTWARQWGFKGPLEVIHNGVETKRFVGEKVAHEGTVLITTSRLVHKNAIDIVIRALPQLPGVRFKILGTGPDGAMLRKLAAERGVADRVEFVGFVHHSQIPGELHAADIFIRPSRSEGMGNSFVEAFAAGIPVIATQEGGIADLLFDAKRNPGKVPTGWAVDVDSPEQVVTAVRDILGNPETTRAVVSNARQFALSRFDWDALAKQVREKVFARLFA